MDDIKLFSKNEKSIGRPNTKAVRIYSEDIGIEFVTEKCTMRSGKRHMTEGIELPNQDKIRTLGEKELTSTWEYWKRTLSNKWR